MVATHTTERAYKSIQPTKTRFTKASLPPSNASSLTSFNAQLTWLYEEMLDSTALWKIIVTSVPLSIPTGVGDGARDGWANGGGNTGYEIEVLCG